MAGNKVLTADNLCISNHSETLSVRVTGVAVADAAFSVADYDNFPRGVTNRIALRINGCATKGPGRLTISETAFPVIAAGGKLPLCYDAKVSAAKGVTKANAATVIFTLKAG